MDAFISLKNKPLSDRRRFRSVIAYSWHRVLRSLSLPRILKYIAFYLYRGILFNRNKTYMYSVETMITSSRGLFIGCVLSIYLTEHVYISVISLGANCLLKLKMICTQRPYSCCRALLLAFLTVSY